MKLIISENQKQVILKALNLSQTVALGELDSVFKTYANIFNIELNNSLLNKACANLDSFIPSNIAQSRMLIYKIINAIDFDFSDLNKICLSVEAYALIGRGQFVLALENLMEKSLVSELETSAYYEVLREHLVSQNSKAAWMLSKDHPFEIRLAYEVSKKLSHDISWRIHSIGGRSSNFQLPDRFTNEPFLEIT